MKTNKSNKLNANSTYKDRHTASPSVPHPGIRKSNSILSHGTQYKSKSV